MPVSTSLSTTASPVAALPAQSDVERRSSSLSDVGERVDEDDMDTMTIDNEDENDENANDTEAETERLDDSPLKKREHRNVVLASISNENDDTAGINEAEDIKNREQSPSLSEASSPPNSSDDELRSRSPSISPKKRKRSIDDHVSETNENDTQGSRGRKSTFSSASRKSPSYIRSRSERNSLSSAVSSPDETLESSKKAHIHPPSISSAHSDKHASEDEVDILGDAVIGQNHHVFEAGTTESNAEEMDPDETGDVELENAAKSQEEVAKKKIALDSLFGLEKCFATLRDRLFDERLAAANEELALLQRPDFIHPELLAMKEAIDRHRLQKERYQQTFLRLKLETLQRESVATKHQIQSQYMQTVREVRDRSLNILNEECYQVQRERRNGDNNVPDALYLFSNDRSQQLRQQTAYNHEVSILAGVAKYKGFPSAPTLTSARTSELESDLRSMGITARPTQQWSHRTASLRQEVLGPSPLNKQISTAEEVFLERNAWANPSHPVHQQRFSRQGQGSRNQAVTKKHQMEDNVSSQPKPHVEQIVGSAARQSPRETETPISNQHQNRGPSHPYLSSQINVNHASPPIKLPVKMEDPQARSSPVPHTFGSPPTAITAGNGHAR